MGLNNNCDKIYHDFIKNISISTEGYVSNLGCYRKISIDNQNAVPALEKRYPNISKENIENILIEKYIPEYNNFMGYVRSTATVEQIKYIKNNGLILLYVNSIDNNQFEECDEYILNSFIKVIGEFEKLNNK